MAKKIKKPVEEKVEGAEEKVEAPKKTGNYEVFVRNPDGSETFIRAYDNKELATGFASKNPNRFIK